ncbi:MAG: helix-turn-helix domain-containing protein [Patescibacteria group bacterium]|nr:helix-turn-helix domain-containing protein [Patescibacteria group bacterium]
MLFTRNKIKEDEETVAEKLRVAREEKKFTLAAAAKKLSINPEYLAALERGDYTALPGGVYEKTFLRQYSSWLGLNPVWIAEKYQKERGGNNGNKDVFSKKKIKKSELAIFPGILKNILLIAAIIILFSYLGYYLFSTFSSPKVEIYQPPDNLVTQNNFVDVIGRADAKTQIAINGRKILKDSTGNFQERINLKIGINTIIISAQNKYSRKKIIEKQILVK